MIREFLVGKEVLLWDSFTKPQTSPLLLIPCRARADSGPVPSLPQIAASSHLISHFYLHHHDEQNHASNKDKRSNKHLVLQTYSCRKIFFKITNDHLHIPFKFSPNKYLNNSLWQLHHSWLFTSSTFYTVLELIKQKIQWIIWSTSPNLIAFLLKQQGSQPVWKTSTRRKALPMQLWSINPFSPNLELSLMQDPT